MNYEATSTKTLLQQILHQHNRRGRGGVGEKETFLGHNLQEKAYCIFALKKALQEVT